MKSSRKYRILKYTLLTVLAASVVLAGVTVFLSRHYKAVLQARLPAMAAKATDSLYLVTAGDFRVNVLTRSISFFDLHLRPDTAVVARRRRDKKLPRVLLDVFVREIEISGLKLGDFAAVKQVVCKKADIYHPVISVLFTDTASRDHHIQERPKPAIERIFAKALSVHEPVISVQLNEEKDAAVIKAAGGELAFREWDFHPGEKPDTARLFYAKKGELQLCNISYRKQGALYLSGLDTLQFNSAAHTASLKGLYIKPALSKDAFYKSVNIQQSIYECALPLVEIDRFQWEQLLLHGTVCAASINISNPDLDIYFSRLYPVNTSNKVGNFPHQLLQKLSIPVNIPLVNLYRGAFRYTEVSSKTQSAGTLDFSSISGYITGISNQPQQVNSGEHCMIRLTGNFMRKSKMAALFDFPLNTKDGAFRVVGQLQDLNASQISETAKAMAMAEVKSLFLHRLDFDIRGNDCASEGETTILYNDLKVKIKKLDAATRRLRNRGFISFIANELLLYNDNPMQGEPVRHAYTQLDRDPTKSFFNIIWKNLFDAGFQTAVRQEGITDIVKKRQANKGKEKLHFFRKLFPKRARKSARQAVIKAR